MSLFSPLWLNFIRVPSFVLAKVQCLVHWWLIFKIELRSKLLDMWQCLDTWLAIILAFKFIISESLLGLSHCVTYILCITVLYLQLIRYTTFHG